MAMQLSGVSGREYWMGGWAVPLGGFCVCSSTLLIFSGRVLFGLDLFLNTDVSVLLLLFGLSSLAMAALGVALGTLTATAKGAQGAAAGVVAMGFVLQLCLSISDGMLVKILFSRNATPWVASSRECLAVAWWERGREGRGGNPG